MRLSPPLQGVPTVSGTDQASASVPGAAHAGCLEEAAEQAEAIQEAEYLLAAGWQKVSVRETPNPIKRWLDPESGKPPRRELVQPAIRDGAGRVTKEAVYQQVCGTPVWFYSREEAVSVQRDREAAKRADLKKAARKP